MCALGRYTRGGWDWDPHEPPFTEAELAHALKLRQSVTPDRRTTRRTDQCPHTPACEGVDMCIERIAWYLRYQTAIEQDLAE